MAQIFPSTMTLNLYKSKKVAAKQGYDLLKRKSDALSSRYRTMLNNIVKLKMDIGKQMKECAFSLTESEWAVGDLKRKVLDLTDKPRIYVKISQDNVAGVKLPLFTLTREESDQKNAVSLNRGGKQIEKSRKKWDDLLEKLIAMAGLQSSFLALDEAIRLTNRRVNALDTVILPQVESTLKFIETELDELEREDIFRLKKVIQVKHTKEEIELFEQEIRLQERENAKLEKMGNLDKSHGHKASENSNQNKKPPEKVFEMELDDDADIVF